MEIEAVRASFRPTPILTLFVGESPPKRGKFFYCGKTALATHMGKAMNAVGGVILIGREGDPEAAFNTPAMPWAMTR